MPRPYLLILLLLTGACLVSCNKDGIEYKNAFEDSYDTWIAFKSASKNSYTYMVTSGSWTGAGSETRISVREGRVTARHFILRQSKDDGTSDAEILEEWYENEGQIQSHERGAAPITLDEVYRMARSEWLIKRSNTDTYFEAGNEGMISVCGYSDRNCADDCFRGITIASVEKLPATQIP
ncbi:MAG TPA: hypothetical protein VGE15_10845 [Sphingobacteriaceae bacterium]